MGNPFKRLEVSKPEYYTTDEILFLKYLGKGIWSQSKSNRISLLQKYLFPFSIRRFNKTTDKNKINDFLLDEIKKCENICGQNKGGVKGKKCIDCT